MSESAGNLSQLTGRLEAWNLLLGALAFKGQVFNDKKSETHCRDEAAQIIIEVAEYVRRTFHPDCPTARLQQNKYICAHWGLLGFSHKT